MRFDRRNLAGVAALALLLAAGALCPPAASQDFRRNNQDPFDPRLENDPFGRRNSIAQPPYTLEQLREVSVDGDLQDVVSLLASDDFAVREQATQQLMKEEARRVQLHALLAGDMLTPEQRYRLLMVLREQLVNAPRGALGIQMEAPRVIGQALEIKVIDLIAGLPAERVLLVGDRIIAIDGLPMFTQEDLQMRVQAKRPGDTVLVTLKRAKVDEQGRVVKDRNEQPVLEVLEVQVPLGPAELLDQANNFAPIGQGRLRGGPVGNNRSARLDNSRRLEAEAIAAAYSPQSQIMRVRGGTSQLAREDDIDQHPRIATLRMQMDMLGGASGEQLRMMQEIWRRELADLLELSQHPGLSEQEREQIRRVAERFLQVMNSGS